MLHHMIDDLKTTSAVALRLTGLLLASAVALFVTTGFLCAAIFIVVLQRYGLPEACLAGAAVFFILTLITALIYMLYKRETQRQPVEAENSALTAALNDPAMIAVALQVGRAIGFKRLVPLLAIAGVALGLSANRRRDGANHVE
jgi:glucan phosphoethanolaminetransferase (alkaline phosphatase superfamily)